MTLIAFIITSVKYHLKLLSAKFLLSMISLKRTFYNYQLYDETEENTADRLKMLSSFDTNLCNCKDLYANHFHMGLNVLVSSYIFLPD